MTLACINLDIGTTVVFYQKPFSHQNESYLLCSTFPLKVGGTQKKLKKIMKLNFGLKVCILLLLMGIVNKALRVCTVPVNLIDWDSAS